MIGFFDSGIGGLSVLAALRRHAPHADAVYYGDTLRGAGSAGHPEEALARIATEGLQTLRMFGAQEIVSASDTVAPAELVHASLGARVIEMTGPAARALQPHRGKRVLLLATPATVITGIYERVLQPIVELEQLPISNLASAIEFDEGDASVRSIVRRALMPLGGRKFDIVVLGCTHFPFVRDIMEEEILSHLGAVEIMDPADAVAKEVSTQFVTAGSGSSYFYLSQDSDIFRKRVEAMFPQKTQVRVL
jgi:glutamate racemase